MDCLGAVFEKRVLIGFYAVLRPAFAEMRVLIERTVPPL
jgi:hypothetical protein